MDTGVSTARAAIVSGTARVLLPLPLERTYDYRVPAGLAVAAGDFVVVPLGARQVIGVAWGEGEGDVAAEKLKDIIALAPVPPVDTALRRMVEWTAAYTLSPPGAVLRMAMSVPSALEPARAIPSHRLHPDLAPAGESADEPERPRFKLTAARRRVVAALADGHPRTAPEIAEDAGVSAAVVRGMIAAGALVPGPPAPRAEIARPDPLRPAFPLSPAQAEAAAALVAKVGQGFSVTLLDGVTGSGKTEVYFEAVAAALKRGRQALVLLPEIALTVQWLERFERRFGAPPVVWHSDLTARERREAWRAIAAGRARVVVGARSALFLPFSELGAIVVDEEHEPSFKQEDGVVYHARDMAVVRARVAEIPVVLASATPSIETTVNCWSERYARLALPERHGGARPPAIVVVDMRSQTLGRQSWLSPTLRTALADTLAAGEQSLLFLNRRGYAPLTLCRACGHRLQCPDCTAWLVEHRLAGRLVCHHCGYSTAPVAACPGCGAPDSFAACGPGIERLAEEAAGAFPTARIAVMASDTVYSPAAAADLVRRVNAHEIDILVGTQIIAKGHHFPLLTLVGVVDADLGLAGGDLRATERTYQLLHQVAGRAGRADRPGRVLVQTYSPEHPVMAALVSGDRDRFLLAEAEAREAHGMPPYGRLAALVVSGLDEAAVDAAAAALGRTAPRDDGIQVFGPAPAPLALLRRRHRRRLLLKARRDVQVQPILRRWIAQVRVKAGVRIAVDVDPYSFM
jgi:primosomal protein N' (replication factor Y)